MTAKVGYVNVFGISSLLAWPCKRLKSATPTPLNPFDHILKKNINLIIDNYATCSIETIIYLWTSLLLSQSPWSPILFILIIRFLSSTRSYKSLSESKSEKNPENELFKLSIFDIFLQIDRIFSYEWRQIFFGILYIPKRDNLRDISIIALRCIKNTFDDQDLTWGLTVKP